MNTRKPHAAKSPLAGLAGARARTVSESVLQTILDTIGDGVLAVGANGHVLAVNHRFYELWRVPPALQQGEDDGALLACVTEQLMDPEGFIQGVSRLYGSQEDSLDLLLFKDGRTYERVSKPLAGGVNKGRLWVFRDITRQQHMEAELRAQIFRDPLTGLGNRAMLAENLERAMAKARRQGTSLAVCYLDLDGFKRINDDYGHDDGDHLLIELGKRFRATLRTEDTIVRVGGDEFIVLLTDLVQPEVAEPVIERLLQTAHQPCVLSASLTVTISASIGVALFPQDGQEDQSLIELADQAMYAAKQAGKNRYVFHQLA